MTWPVPLRGSMRSTATASSSVATSLSMPNRAICTGGSVVVRSALPSLVTSTIVPVSAMAMFAPELPTVASMNFFRSDGCAGAKLADDVPRLGGVFGQVHDTSDRGESFCELFEQLGQAVEVGLAASFQVGTTLGEIETLERLVAPPAQPDHRAGQRLLQSGVV